MQIRHYCNSHASNGSGALRSQSSVHCCVQGALPSQMRAVVSRSYPGGGLPLHNSGSSDVYVYPWRSKRGELCVCPQANGRLALARVASPLRLHFQICEQNRNDNTRHMSLQTESKTSGDLPNPALGKRFIVGSHVLPGSALSAETT